MSSHDGSGAAEAESCSADIEGAQLQVEQTINPQSADTSKSTSSATSTVKSARRALRVRKECHRSNHTDENDVANDDRHDLKPEEKHDPVVKLLDSISDLSLFDQRTDATGGHVLGFHTIKNRDSMATLAQESAERTPKRLVGHTPSTLTAGGGSIPKSPTGAKPKTPKSSVGSATPMHASNDEIDQWLAERSQPVPHTCNVKEMLAKYELEFPLWMKILYRGYNLILHGLGSKRVLLDYFCRTHLMKGKAIILHGCLPDLSVKDVLDVIAHDLHLMLTTISTRKVLHAIERKLRRSPDIHLFLLVHNLDGEPMRNELLKIVLTRLITMPNVHVVATIDSISLPSMWTALQLKQFNFVWKKLKLPDATETSF